MFDPNKVSKKYRNFTLKVDKFNQGSKLRYLADHYGPVVLEQTTQLGDEFGMIGEECDMAQTASPFTFVAAEESIVISMKSTIIYAYLLSQNTLQMAKLREKAEIKLEGNLNLVCEIKRAQQMKDKDVKIEKIRDKEQLATLREMYPLGDQNIAATIKKIVV